MTKNRRHDIVKPSKFKTSMCTFFMSAEGCPFGDKCAFAHGEEELRCEPKDSTAGASTALHDGATAAAAAAATSSPTSSHASEPGEGRAGAEAGSTKPQSHANVNASATAKRKAKKNRMDGTGGAAVTASTHGGPGGKAEVAQGRCRPQRDRRAFPPPPPMQSQGPMPSAAYSLSVAPAPPGPFALYGDFSMAYGGIPAMSGMPYYIPTVGNHPFSVINNNQHAINVVPHMQSPMPYAAAAPHPQSFPQPPLPPQSTPSPQSSMPSSPLPLHAKHAAVSALNTSSTASAAAGAPPLSDEAKRRPRQAMRHVVSSNTMAHTHGRHASSASSAAPAEVATPQYVYGLMAAAGVPMNGATSLPPPANTTAAAPADGGVAHANNAPPPPPPSSQPSTPHPQQPRLIVVPHKSGSGGFVVPSNLKNYHPPAAALPSHDNSPTRNGDGESGAAAAVEGRGRDAGVAGADAGAYPPFAATRPQPTFVQIPLKSGETGNSDGAGGAAAKTVGDALWGPAGGSLNPLTSSALDDPSRDYNALLSGLGIGGSSYTTIPLDELVRQRGPTRDDDDGAFSADFDWTGALERWLHTAKEESANTAAAKKAASPAEETTATATATAETATPSAPAAPATTTTTTAAAAAPELPKASQSVTSALNHTPVLMEGEAKAKAPAATTAAEGGRRKPAVVCQVSRAGTKPAPARRRAPVMTNQFKSSCAAEADSGSVLLYCAEKNTLVYITSANGAAAAAATASHAGSLQSNGAADVAGRSSGSPDSPTVMASSIDLGLDVRFNPGRKKHSVLEPEAGDNEAEYCI